MQRKLKVGLIGYGYAGKNFHAPLITSIPGMELAKVVQQKLDSAKERYPGVEVVRSANDLFQDQSIDLIIIATPSTDHYTFTRDALLAGKHVIVEKPFTVRSSEARSLIALAREQKKMLSVFHNRRFDGDFKTIRELHGQGLLGRLTDVRFSWDRYMPKVDVSAWRESSAPGAGILYDLAIHFIDQALYLFGMPSHIHADIRKQREHAETDDFFDIVLTYENGPRVTLEASLLRREKGPRYTLHGTKGSFVKYGEDPQEEALLQGLTPAWADWGKDKPDRFGALDLTFAGQHFIGRIETMAGSYEQYYQNVYDHIVHGAELIVKPEDAQAAVRLIELAQESSESGKTIAVNL
ncbi:oxidoreductase [Paenibacillus sp. MY03]|uniref:oxidoreductase n=1 Tax=Paenibacillus sp. MY03 TaxID=302980 RepID=UPI000B3CBAE6|nr:oxidoreductase [Paenibacillus sp. MY03]OUS76200.1 oxidoreductase [Paenibacillus sp. MY03]